MSNELVVVEKTDEQHNMLLVQQATPEQWASRRQQFNTWVNTQLRKGIDYGEIKGVDRPTLLKPGAEKIIQLFGCVADATVTHREQDLESGYLNVEVTVNIVDLRTGNRVGAGIGSCSTLESKYRWRKEWYNGNGTPQGDGWTKTSGNKWFRRVQNPDMADQWNTVIKMAKKRALVDAALSISGASEMFTQDIEDIVDVEFTEVPQKANPAPASAPSNWTQDQKDVDAFLNWAGGLGCDKDEAAVALEVDNIADFTGDKKQAAAMVKSYLQRRAAIPVMESAK